MTLKTRTVHFRLTEEQYQQARAKAKEEGLTMSQKVRWFVSQWTQEDKPMDTGLYGMFYNIGWADGADGVMRENPYTDPNERAAYDAGRRDGAKYYREHEDD